ncbi:MAG: secretin N-terminal domain-containing protein [Bacteroidota bacterium]
MLSSRFMFERRDIRTCCVVLAGLLGGLLIAGASDARAQTTPTPTAGIIELEERLPRPALEQIGTLNFRGADLRDVLRAIAAESGLNLIVDDSVQGRVTVNFQDVAVIDALRFLAEEYTLALVQTGSIFRVRVPAPAPPPTPPPPPEPVVLFAEGRLTLDLEATPLSTLVRLVTQRSGTNLVLAQGVTGTVSGFVQDAPLDVALRTVLASSGFTLERDGEIFVVTRSTEEGQPIRGRRDVAVVDGRVALRLRNADVADAVREIARQAAVPIVTYTLPEGRRLTAEADGLTVEQALRVVLRGTGTAFRRETSADGPYYLVGTQAEDGLVATRLLRLGYIAVEGLVELLPPGLQSRATIQPVPEQNALLVSGTNDAIAELEAFLAEVDYPAPQVLIETLVVDLLDTDISNLGFDFGRGLLPGFDSTATPPQPFDYEFRGTTTGELEVVGSGANANDILAPGGDLFGLGGIGKLPADFFFRVRALEQEGRVAVRNRPQVSTLSGNTATISIGTTQYFLLETSTPITGRNDVLIQETQRFEQIDANVTLEITPFVSPYGEVTALIRPSFSTPVGEFSAGVPPTISTQEIEARVRLRDGETIILGGLISDEDVVSDFKIPILGDIPILGRLFRSRSRSKRESELVIYITPHVFYGDGRDDAQWRALADSSGLRLSPLNPQESFWERFWLYDDAVEEDEPEQDDPPETGPPPEPRRENSQGDQGRRSEERGDEDDTIPTVSDDLPPLDIGPVPSDSTGNGSRLRLP